ncbi:uncharacterized protein HaLaN_20626, partial [Haematococcus lacustris]
MPQRRPGGCSVPGSSPHGRRQRPLIWALMTEQRPPEEAFNPEVKRHVPSSGAIHAVCWLTRLCHSNTSQGVCVVVNCRVGKGQPPRLLGAAAQVLHASHWEGHSCIRCRRSGWQPPRDFGLWDVATSLAERVLAGLSPASRQYWDAEAGYFDKVTAISGILKKLDKDARRAKIASELATFRPERPDLYIPTNIDCRVLGHIPTSGTPMQSAAKVPILVAFQVEQQPDGQPVTSSTHHT